MNHSVFIGSSVEGLDVAYALQANLDHAAEVTVWDQGAFAPSKYTLEGLIDILTKTDIGVFVFSPDDIVELRGVEHKAVRDNVIFELGLFIGRLGRERCLIVHPKNVTEFRFPSDLLGLTMLSFVTDRQDQNLRAALGSASNEIRKALERLGAVEPEVDQPSDTVELSEDDIISIIQSWMGSRDARLNTQVMKFVDVDKELKLPQGSAKKYIIRAARQWGYVMERQGNSTILLRELPDKRVVGVSRSRMLG